MPKKVKIPMKDDITIEKNSNIKKKVNDNKIEKCDSSDSSDSSDISDIDDNEIISDAFNYDVKKSHNKSNDEEYDNLDDDARKEYIQTVVLERVIKYIKLDDVIKKKQSEHKKEMKVIKDSKDQLEEFLIEYLDKVDEEYIQLANKSTLVKTEVKTKAPPKIEDIGVCLIEGFKKHEIYNDDADIKRVVKDLIETIDAKREIKTRKYLKRTSEEDKKEKKIKTIAKSVEKKKYVKK